LNLFTNHLAYQFKHFAGFGMTVHCQLGIQFLSIDCYFERAAIRRHEQDRLDHMLIILEQLASQAHGPGGVMSDRTIDDLDFQHCCSYDLQKPAPAILAVTPSNGKFCLRNYIIGERDNPSGKAGSPMHQALNTRGV